MKIVFLMAGVLPLLAANALALELESILSQTRVSPPARVAFREERHNAMFVESLHLTGFLEYLEGGELRKIIDSPFNESFLVRAEQVEIERGGETQVLPIRKSRALRTMLGGIQAILAGETDQLEQVFSYELTGSESDWVLQLTPKSKRIAKQLNGLTVSGDSESVTSIYFDLQGGEWHRLELLREAPGQ